MQFCNNNFFVCIVCTLAVFNHNTNYCKHVRHQQQRRWSSDLVVVYVRTEQLRRTVLGQLEGVDLKIHITQDQHTGPQSDYIGILISS